MPDPSPLNGGSSNSTTPQTTQNRCYQTDSAEAVPADDTAGNGVYVAPLPALDDHYNWWATEKCGCSHCEHDACLVCGALIHEYHSQTHQKWHLALVGRSS